MICWRAKLFYQFAQALPKGRMVILLKVGFFPGTSCSTFESTRLAGVFYSKLLLHRSVKDTRCIDSNSREWNTLPEVPTVPTYGTDMATYPCIYVYDAPGVKPSSLWQLWSWKFIFLSWD